MSSQKTVTVVGAGIAGLSSAVFLTEIGFKVTLIEASPKLGGRAYSFFDKEKNQFFDNGQHILAGWYKNTFEYLKIIGSYDKLNFQKELEVNFINTEKEIFKLKCPDTAAPMNLIQGLLRFGAFGLKDKFALKNIKKMLKDDNDFAKKFVNVRELLIGIKQTQNLIKYFWEPFTLAVFNSRLENVSVRNFLNVLHTGFNEKNNSMLVIPNVNLNELFIDGAIEYFKRNDAKVLFNRRVRQILISKVPNEDYEYNKEYEDEFNLTIEGLVLEDGTELNSDFYISAVAFFDFKKLFEESIFIYKDYKSDLLKTSSIVSVHLFFEKVPDEMIPYNSFGMTGLIGTIVQWIFKRSDKHLSLVISGADDLQITDMSHEDILKLCVNDLMQTIEGFDKLKITDYKVIKEKRATFIPDERSNKFRESQNTYVGNFYIVGDWTNTGFPATIEGAVSSSKYVQRLLANYQLSLVDGK